MKIKIKFFFKGVFHFLAYTVAGLCGCALAFFISLQFLTPVFSEPDSDKASVEPLKPGKQKGVMDTFKAVGKDVKTATQILKDVMVGTFGKKEKKKDPPPASKPPQESAPPPEEPPPPREEGVEGRESLEPQAPEPQESESEEPPPQEEEGVEGRKSLEPQAPVEPQEFESEESPPQEEKGVEGRESLEPQAPEPQESEPEEISPPREEGVEGRESLEPQAPEPQESEPEEIPPPEEESSMSGSLLKLKSYMEPFIYDPSSERRNPFEDITQKKGSAAKIRVIKTPLEQYALKDIKLKGIIWGVKSPKALFQLPDQQGFYTLLKGERVGRYGVIREIREDEVEIQETIVKGDDEGQQTETRKTIKRIDRLNYEAQKN